MASPDFCIPAPDFALLEWIHRTLSSDSSHPLMRKGAIASLEGLIQSIKPIPRPASPVWSHEFAVTAEDWGRDVLEAVISPEMRSSGFLFEVGNRYRISIEEVNEAGQ